MYQYRVIYNFGQPHIGKEIATTIEMLQDAVKFHLACGHTIVEVQRRERVTWSAGWAEWQNT